MKTEFTTKCASPTIYHAKTNSGRVFVGTWNDTKTDSPNRIEDKLEEDERTTVESKYTCETQPKKRIFKNFSLFSQVFKFIRVKGDVLEHISITCHHHLQYLVNSSENVISKTINDRRQTNSIGFDLIFLYEHFAGQNMQNSELVKHNELKESCTEIENEGISNIKAYLLLLKSFVGTGVLLLPSAFHNGGLLFSIVVFVFIGVYSFWCYYLLAVVKKATNVSCFGEIGNVVYGSVMKFIILLSLVLSQLGFSSAGIIFVANNMKTGLEILLKLENIKYIYLMLFQLILYLPFGLITDISKFSLATLVSNILILGGLGIVFTLCCITLSNKSSTEIFNHINLGFNPNGWSFFVGTAIFAFEGIGLIIPVQDSMRTPEKFPLILGLVILSSGILFLSIAVIGYLAFGDQVETIILQSLSTGGIIVALLQLIYSFAIMIATPLQNLPIVNLLEELLFSKEDNPVYLTEPEIKHTIIKREKTDILSATYLLGFVSNPINCFIILICNKLQRIFTQLKCNSNILTTLKVTLRISITLFVVFLA